MVAVFSVSFVKARQGGEAGVTAIVISDSRLAKSEAAVVNLFGTTDTMLGQVKSRTIGLRGRWKRILITVLFAPIFEDSGLDDHFVGAGLVEPTKPLSRCPSTDMQCLGSS